MSKRDNEGGNSADNETNEESEAKSKSCDKKDGETFRKPFTSSPW